MMNDALKRILISKKNLWVEGQMVSIFYDETDNYYHVCKIDDETYDVVEKTYTEEKLDDGITQFLEWFENDRISFTDGEINA